MEDHHETPHLQLQVPAVQLLPGHLLRHQVLPVHPGTRGDRQLAAQPEEVQRHPPLQLRGQEDRLLQVEHEGYLPGGLHHVQDAPVPLRQGADQRVELLHGGWERAADPRRRGAVRAPARQALRGLLQGRGLLRLLRDQRV